MTHDLSAVTPDFAEADVRSIAARLLQDATAAAQPTMPDIPQPLARPLSGIPPLSAVPAQAASPSEIIFLRGTTEAINLVAQTVGRCFLRPGDEIILTVLEHHANIVPWQMAARETGAVIRVVPVDERGEIQLDAFESLLGPRTKLVSLTHASNSLGTILPVEQMTAAAKRQGALVLIDGAQTVSHMPVNVQSIGCDFFVFSGHKIFAPTGIGALYARRELQQVMPPWQGGGNMIRTVTFEETTWSEPPAKFEAGTPSVADAVGLQAAINYLLALG